LPPELLMVIDLLNGKGERHPKYTEGEATEGAISTRSTTRNQVSQVPSLKARSKADTVTGCWPSPMLPPIAGSWPQVISLGAAQLSVADEPAIKSGTVAMSLSSASTESGGAQVATGGVLSKTTTTRSCSEMLPMLSVYE